jgi:hypothetical protein
MYAIVAESKQMNDDEYMIKVYKSFPDELAMNIPDLDKQMEGQFIAVIKSSEGEVSKGVVTFLDKTRTFKFRPIMTTDRFDWMLVPGSRMQFFQGRKVEVAIGPNVHGQLDADKEFRRAVRDMRRKQKRYFHLAKGGSTEERQVVLKESIAAEALVDRLLGPEGSEDGKLS